MIDPVVRLVRAFLPLFDHGQILGQVPEGEVPVAVPQSQTSTDHLAGDWRTRRHQQSGHVVDQVRVLPAQPGSQSVPKLLVDETELALSAVSCQLADVLAYLTWFQTARHLRNQQLQNQEIAPSRASDLVQRVAGKLTAGQFTTHVVSPIAQVVLHQVRAVQVVQLRVGTLGQSRVMPNWPRGGNHVHAGRQVLRDAFESGPACRRWLSLIQGVDQNQLRPAGRQPRCDRTG